MLVSITATAAYDLPSETFLLLMVEPALRGAAHAVRQERLTTTPTPFGSLSADGFGNPQRRLVAPAGRFCYEFSATVEVAGGVAVPPDAAEVPLRDVPPEVLAFTLPSRYCQSDLLARMARGEFGGLEPGGARVLAVADWVRRNVEYRSGSTDAKTSAFDTATERSGVCRDFAHLVIAFCRALGVPARYASGYALGLEPEDFHGYAQVFLGGAWHDVDATVQEVRPALVPIAVGRDAADVAMATLWGAGALLEQSVRVRRAD
jgi:transglutaminase-like putative cysteine protease